jgi:hypothetical protein
MRTNIAETSLSAYFSLSPAIDLQPKEKQIMALFEAPMRMGRNPVELSRQQISKVLNLPINCICGRVNSLVTKGQLIERGERVDPQTHKSQKLLRLPVVEQAELSL